MKNIDFIGFFLFTMVVLFLSIPIMLYWSFGLEHLWRWFIVPIGLPALTIKQCIGAGIVWSFLNYKNSKHETKELEERFKDYFLQVFGTVMYITLTLFLGYIWHMVLNHIN